VTRASRTMDDAPVAKRSGQARQIRLGSQDLLHLSAAVDSRADLAAVSWTAAQAVSCQGFISAAGHGLAASHITGPSVRSQLFAGYAVTVLIVVLMTCSRSTSFQLSRPPRFSGQHLVSVARPSYLLRGAVIGGRLDRADASGRRARPSSVR